MNDKGSFKYFNQKGGYNQKGGLHFPSEVQYSDPKWGPIPYYKLSMKVEVLC